ncbi:HupE/UreJ family protein [Flavobacterium sp. WLB]|uniref:HupE/UreJ family protein n=2 Tax=Flavobacterium TaxID=237 RepID=A0A9N8P0T8_9FLAO|nr:MULTISPECIES: HupE/UreJ family protein [Flavobacterium]KOP37694.1 HupE / UreJ protein [Flavobacterium sp. VMW]OWU91178.1 HupE / UreJ protein [Flavobacterium sp. NLM]PUU69470.1 HupE/UreJ family protein [Flavobacterium sp. WLB]UUF15088.1 HupE/UreJ family protein [Flavobacterium panici]CAC9973352.1 HupE/UreJ family protein [Flavobacterium panici]
MSQFWIYFQIGLKHVLDINAYDHVLFLIALTVPYSFKDWKRILLLVSVFTIGHTLALILSVFGIIAIKVNIVEFLIPITILITALYHLFTAGKATKNDGVNVVFFVTLFFGIIHGLGFSNYFKTILGGSASSKLLPLGEFALGIEAAQLVVVFVVLVISYIVQTVFRFSKRDWALVMSAFIIGVVIPMIIESPIWNR